MKGMILAIAVVLVNCIKISSSFPLTCKGNRCDGGIAGSAVCNLKSCLQVFTILLLSAMMSLLAGSSKLGKYGSSSWSGRSKGAVVDPHDTRVAVSHRINETRGR